MCTLVVSLYPWGLWWATTSQCVHRVAAAQNRAHLRLSDYPSFGLAPRWLLIEDWSPIERVKVEAKVVVSIDVSYMTKANLYSLTRSVVNLRRERSSSWLSQRSWLNTLKDYFLLMIRICRKEKSSSYNEELLRISKYGVSSSDSGKENCVIPWSHTSLPQFFRRRTLALSVSIARTNTRQIQPRVLSTSRWSG